LVSEHDGWVSANPASRNRAVTVTQTNKYGRFFTPGDDPQNLPGAVEDLVG
jgi:hypothetical protein